MELDRDDGRLQYEVKIVYNNMEYDFDIDASTGSILSRDVESHTAGAGDLKRRES